MTLSDDNWTSISSTQASYEFDDTLLSTETTAIEITLMVNDYVLWTITNRAEISEDDGSDVDSTPDTTNDETTESPEDDTIDNENGDEDDHDPAVIHIDPYYDLALVKYLTTSDVVQPGDIATFEVKVTNQGNIPANGIEITDYIPEWLIQNDSDWVDNGNNTATYALPAQIDPGESFSVEIDLMVTDFVNDTSEDIVNWAEISADDSADYGGDVDSMPDDENFNTPEETDDLDDDNVINEDGKNGGDEDDHDPAILPVWDVYDLALTKKVVDTGDILPWSAITFEIEVLNQWNMPASDIQITDYIPDQLLLSDGDWTDNGDGTATIAIPWTVNPGESTTVEIDLLVDELAFWEIINWAEISNDDGDDVDSNPDSDPENDIYDDSDDVVNNANGDEDDHDPAPIYVEAQPDLALKKVLDSELAFVNIGDNATFIITVYNQGNVHAQDVIVTDYIPTGLVLNDDNWTLNSDGTASSMPLTIPVDQSIDIEITLTADSVQSESYLINWAEISVDNFDEFGWDVDSIPNTDVSDDNQPAQPSDETNDEINEDGKDGGDEDDHDPAELLVVNTRWWWGGWRTRSVAPRVLPEPVPEVIAEEVIMPKPIVIPEPKPLTIVEIAWWDAQVEWCVHHDVNGDGNYEASEIWLAWMPVTIKDADGNIVGSMLTDEDGCYHFVDLVAGEYCIEYEDASTDFDPVSSNPWEVLGEQISSIAIGNMTHCMMLEAWYHSVENDFGLRVKEEILMQTSIPIALPPLLPKTGVTL